MKYVYSEEEELFEELHQIKDFDRAKKIVSEYIKNHHLVIKWVNSMVCELYLN